MTRVWTTKGSLYFKLLGASFLLIELLFYNTSACFVYDTLGKLQDLSFSKSLYKVLRCRFQLKENCSLLKVYKYFWGELLHLFWSRSIFTFKQVLINLRKYRLMPKGIGMWLMMKSCHSVTHIQLLSMSGLGFFVAYTSTSIFPYLLKLSKLLKFLWTWLFSFIHINTNIQTSYVSSKGLPLCFYYIIGLN